MERRTRFYVSWKNPLTWLMALCLVGSAVTRIVFACLKGSGESLEVWSQIVLPVAAALLYVLITLLNGKEMFYKTAIPIWMMAAYLGFAVSSNYGFGRMVSCLFWVAFIFFAVLYTDITSGRKRYLLLLPLLLCFPLGVILYLNREPLLARDWAGILPIVPDLLVILGLFLLTFALRIHPSHR